MQEMMVDTYDDGTTTIFDKNFDYLHH